MDDAASLLLEAMHRGVKLAVNGDRIRFFPPEAMTDDLLDRIQSVREDLIDILTTDTGPQPQTHRYTVKEKQLVAGLSPATCETVDRIKRLFDARVVEVRKLSDQET